jgi:hypothetical protein
MSKIWQRSERDEVAVPIEASPVMSSNRREFLHVMPAGPKSRGRQTLRIAEVSQDYVRQLLHQTQVLTGER